MARQRGSPCGGRCWVGFGFIDHLRSLRRAEAATYVVTAMDAETFGHHVSDWERLFLAHVYAQFDCEPDSVALDIQQRVNLAAQHRQILEAPASQGRELRVVTATELLEMFPAGTPTTPRPSSWSTSGEDLARGVPYPLWNEPSNHVQSLLWRHLRICQELVDLASRTSVPEGRPSVDIARGLLDRALHSCQFWWASRRPMWDLNMIERGLAEQRAVVINATKAVVTSKAPRACREAAEDREAIAEDLSRRVRRHLLTA